MTDLICEAPTWQSMLKGIAEKRVNQCLHNTEKTLLPQQKPTTRERIKW